MVVCSRDVLGCMGLYLLQLSARMFKYRPMQH